MGEFDKYAINPVVGEFDQYAIDDTQSVGLTPVAQASIASQAELDNTSQDAERNAMIQRGSALVKQRGIGPLGAIRRGFQEEATLGQGAEIEGTLKGSTEALLTGETTAIPKAVQQEQDIEAALKEESPISYTAGQILGFLTPGSAAKTVATQSGKFVAKALSKMSQSPSMFNLLSKAFLIGAAETGAISASKELLSTGDVSKALSKGAKEGSFGGAVGAGLVGGAGFLSKVLDESKAADYMVKGMSTLIEKGKGNKLVREVENLSAKILGEDSPEFIQTILRSPERVKELVKRRVLDNADIGNKIRNNVVTLKKSLGVKVDEFRQKAMRDTRPMIDTGPIKEEIESLRRSFMTTSGVNGLDAVPEGKVLIETMEQFLTPNKISPSDAMIMLDLMDPKIFGREALTNVGAAALRVAKSIRARLKDQLRAPYKEWVVHDGNYSKLLDLVDNETNGILPRLERNAETFVNTLFRSGKSQERKDLFKVGILASKIDPSGKAKEMTRETVEELLSVRAALKIRPAIPKRTDSLYDKASTIANRYAAVGAGIGSSVLGGAGFSVAGPAGALVAAPAGGTIGGVIGYKIGAKLGNPIKILDAAIKNKQLSVKSRLIARDLKEITQIGGVDAFDNLINIIPSTLAGAEGLINFFKQQKQYSIDEGNVSNDVSGLVNKSMESAQSPNP